MVVLVENKNRHEGVQATDFARAVSKSVVLKSQNRVRASESAASKKSESLNFEAAPKIVIERYFDDKRLRCMD